MVTANAAGELAPTFVLFSGQSLPKNAAEMAPKDFAFGYSDNGWMTAKSFYEYIANFFEPWLIENKIKRPVILYMDGHSSHMTLHLSKFCSEHEIILIALLGNATHIMQPLDVSFFRPFKIQWEKTFKTFCTKSCSIGIQKYQFAPVVKQTLDAMNIKKLLQNGFKRCGLSPFDVSAIDFTKVFNCNKSSSQEELSNETTVVESNRNILPEEVLPVIEKLMTKDQLEAFRANESPIWRGRYKDQSLFEVWYKMSHPDVNSTNNSDNFEVT